MFVCLRLFRSKRECETVCVNLCDIPYIACATLDKEYHA